MSEKQVRLKKRDALGNAIVVGNRYGFSTDSNGVTQVTIGTATKETEKFVTLQIEVVKRGLYSDLPKPVEQSRKTVNCKAMKLFPVMDNK